MHSLNKSNSFDNINYYQMRNVSSLADRFKVEQFKYYTYISELQVTMVKYKKGKYS
jgi:hypothetical protein